MVPASLIRLLLQRRIFPIAAFLLLLFSETASARMDSLSLYMAAILAGNSASSTGYDFLTKVKPILDKRCVVCHSCYNSPCQLKLSSYEGVDRGSSKKTIYDATRLTTMDPTRLFIDAGTTEEWRQKEFFSVTESNVDMGINNSLMMQLLSHKIAHPESTGEYHPEADDLICSATDIELDGYLSKHPNRGMPFGFPPLTRKEFSTIEGWLANGAKGPDAVEQATLTAPAVEDIDSISQWEHFLNTDSAKYGMTARYLYEHLFLAHIKFDTNSNVYYKLLRSTTPPGEAIRLINTLRPYDNPGTERFYYRFRKIHATIVHKTHMVFQLDNAKMKRFIELFIEPQWLRDPHLVGYDPKLSANPFAAFEQIPPKSRYQFLLDNAHYIIMTFIRGPVCKGQVALNVIPDHFWIMFLDPEYDLSVRYPGFLSLHREDLKMPIEKGSSFDVGALINNRYQEAVMRYFQARQEQYQSQYYFTGIGYDAIWKGNKADDAPVLTVYRHFNSGSVHKGVLGDLPRTMWVIDYPLFERIYYALVAGFDVYGTLGHQLAVRLYMDTLRVEGESYFLEFLPQNIRREMIESWYMGVEYNHIHTFQTEVPALIEFSTADPKREFIEHVVGSHILPETEISFDHVNYLRVGKPYPSLPEQYETVADYMQGFKAASKPGSTFISYLNVLNTNLAHVRVRENAGKDKVITMVVNRWHDNVTYIFGEKNVQDTTKDRIDFIEGFIGSYPNYYFDVHKDDLPEFLDLLAVFHNSEKEMAKLRKFGVNRAEDDFWLHYDWFQMRFNKDQPVQSGLFDLNRYNHTAMEKL